MHLFGCKSVTTGVSHRLAPWARRCSYQLSKIRKGNPVDDQTRHVVIAGAGHAGGAAAAMLRQLGWPGAITLIGEEPVLPYQRPPLSKAWLKGEAAGEDLALRPATFYSDASIDLRTNTCVVRIDRSTRTVALSDGSSLHYDVLILALGARGR